MPISLSQKIKEKDSTVEEFQQPIEDTENSPVAETEVEIPDRLLTDTQIIGYDSIDSQFSYYGWSVDGLDLSNKTILDMGCGRADFINFLESRGPSEYYGIDTNPLMVKIAKKKWNADIIQTNWLEYDGPPVDFTFNIFGILYKDFEGDKYEYLKKSIEKAYEMSNIACIFVLLCDNSGIDQYCSYEVSEVVKLVDNYAYGIDRTINANNFKLGIFK